ncbi:hypothetical protein RE476_02715 [Methanolobus mangrovi]|uniref:Uncharacterized protein n=1 Tax=Methanolobus mangrovi TaxID=3072977 RepID=A0AA51UJB6_9EURY|nr:hypothetical protein [Methanolobus mangrovi]WMW22751.1 hypothetical protein RE476_02715 [Methanolobus mangrovi]
MSEKQHESLEANQNSMVLVIKNDETKMQLLGQQLDLYRVLLGKNQMLATIYLGTLIALKQNENPDHLALAAHGARELMEKLPSILDVPMKAHGESLKSKVIDLEGVWLNALNKSKTLNNQKWEGEIDRPLSKLLSKLDSFFEWYNNHYPRRKAEVAKVLRELDISGLTLPNYLEDSNIKKWSEIRDFFQGVSHHQKITTSEIFYQKLEALEIFLLERLLPQTFIDIKEIDELILEGESNA